MPREFTAEQHFATDPVTAFTMLCDPAYITRKLTESGGHDLVVESDPTPEGGAELRLCRTMPAQVPSYAKSLIGDTITADEHHSWGPAQADGSRAGTFTASFPGAPVAVAGTMRLQPDDDGTGYLVQGSVKASVPLVGGKIEDLVKEQLARFMRKEQQVADSWLAGEQA